MAVLAYRSKLAQEEGHPAPVGVFIPFVN
jgi:hypothetical protein